MTQTAFLILFLSFLAFGSVIGAFFGTADYRIRHKEPLLTSHCFCPSCHHKLADIHQVPIVSWLLLGGKCHYCKTPIPLRYPLIEGFFLLSYGFLFLIFWRQPLLLLGLCLTLVCILILLRCKGHFLHAFRGIAIFLGFHAFYGGFLLTIFASFD